MPEVSDRREELAANVAEVRQRIAEACAATGRDVAGVTLIAVTKTRPASDVRLLASLGIGNGSPSRAEARS